MRVIGPSLHVSLDTMRANPARTLLSALGIVMGAASLVGVLSLADGSEQFARRAIELNGLQSLSLSPVLSDTVDGVVIPRPGFPLFSVNDATSLAKAIPAARVAMTTQGTGTFVTRPSGPTRAATVTGVFGDAEAAGTPPLAHGRFPTADEQSRGARVAVISNALARELGGADVARRAGDTVSLGGSSWTIVGVLEGFAGERGFRVLVPLAASSGAMVPVAAPRPPTILLQAARVEAVEATRTAAEAWIAAAHPRWRAERQVTLQALGLNRLRQLNQGMALFRILMGAFAAISLAVGGVGIMNVLLASVAERTREIGVRKAAGARRSDIAAQFLAESILISLTGAAAGAVAGLAGAMAATAVMRAQTGAIIYAGLTWTTVAVGIGAAVTVGLVFGAYPALKAARLSPIDAMRYE